MRMLLIIAVNLVGIGRFVVADLSQDRLTPLYVEDEKLSKYQRLLTEKLGVTPFDYGRVLDEPSFGPESMVSVYSRVQKGRRIYFISLVRAGTNLWQRTESMREPHKAREIGIQKTDAEIPQPVAENIKHVWIRMLQATRAVRRSRVEFELSGYLGFSIQLPDHSLSGELWLPPRGPKTQGLVKISGALWDYCRASPLSRPSIAKKIDLETKQLLALLQD